MTKENLKNLEAVEIILENSPESNTPQIRVTVVASNPTENSRLTLLKIRKTEQLQNLMNRAISRNLDEITESRNYVGSQAKSADDAELSNTYGARVPSRFRFQIKVDRTLKGKIRVKCVGRTDTGEDLAQSLPAISQLGDTLFNQIALVNSNAQVNHMQEIQSAMVAIFDSKQKNHEEIINYSVGIRTMRLQASNKVVEIFSDDDDETSENVELPEDQKLVKRKG